MQIHFPKIKYILGATLLSGAMVTCAPIYAQNKLQQDTFVKTSVSVSGTNNKNILAKAPNPNIKICGVNKKAKIVVDLSKNILYTYDNNGNANNAYLIASGKSSTPTHSGVRIVTHIESYPYRTAPKTSQRRRTPRAFGPKIICLDIINPKTGETTPTGEFIHGNNNPESLGKYASHGCMRMDNEVIKELSTFAKPNDIVIVLPKK